MRWFVLLNPNGETVAEGFIGDAGYVVRPVNSRGFEEQVFINEDGLRVVYPDVEINYGGETGDSSV